LTRHDNDDIFFSSSSSLAKAGSTGSRKNDSYLYSAAQRNRLTDWLVTILQVSSAWITLNHVVKIFSYYFVNTLLSLTLPWSSSLFCCCCCCYCFWAVIHSTALISSTFLFSLFKKKKRINPKLSSRNLLLFF
jgi:hypothetical protein